MRDESTEAAIQAVGDEWRRAGLRVFVDVLRVVTVALRETEMPLEARAEMLPRMVTIAMGTRAPGASTTWRKTPARKGARQRIERPDPLASLMEDDDEDYL